MKQLVVYSSQGGNTQKLAEEVFRQLLGEKDIKPVADAPDPSGYDLVCVGFWLKGGQPDPASLEYLKKCSTSTVFFFATHGAAAGSDHAKMGLNKAIEATGGAIVAGTFSCPGTVAPKVIEMASAKDPQPPWLKDAPAAEGHPDKDDLIALGRTMVKAGLKS